MSESALHAACLRHMPLVAGYNSALDALGVWWHKVALIGKINSHTVADTLIEDMHDTQRRFQELQGRLIDNLVRENVRKLELELSARTQASIDILVRNLFERTADVGFLATDDDIRTFLLQPEANTDSIKAMVARLGEYTAKYSVYDEIIILDLQGRVRAHLETDNPVSQSSDPLLDFTLSSAAPYVETFRPSGLQAQRRAAHIFSAPITDGDGPGAAVLGVLCLCFRFDDEMRGIFANLARPGEIIAIIDDSGCVIASSDEGVLQYINGLYTVYSNLLLFDNNGVITAVSNAQASSWVNQPWPHMDDVHAALALGAAQQYAVSPFAATPLYDGRHTYFYLANDVLALIFVPL